MNENEQIFFLEINNFEFIFSVGENKENENFKLIYQNSIPIKGVNDSKIIDFDLFFNLLKDNIYNIEQKLNLVLKNVILILDNFDCSLINFTGFKKLRFFFFILFFVFHFKENFSSNELLLVLNFLK